MQRLKDAFNIQSIQHPAHALFVDVFWNNFTYKHMLAINLNRAAKQNLDEKETISLIEQHMKDQRTTNQLFNIIIGALWAFPIHPILTPLSLALLVSSCKKIPFTNVDNKFAHPGLYEKNDHTRATELVKKYYPKRFKDKPYPKAV